MSGALSSLFGTVRPATRPTPTTLITNVGNSTGGVAPGNTVTSGSAITGIAVGDTIISVCNAVPTGNGTPTITFGFVNSPVLNTIYSANWNTPTTANGSGIINSIRIDKVISLASSSTTSSVTFSASTTEGLLRTFVFRGVSGLVGTPTIISSDSSTGYPSTLLPCLDGDLAFGLYASGPPKPALPSFPSSTLNGTWSNAQFTAPSSTLLQSFRSYKITAGGNGNQDVFYTQASAVPNSGISFILGPAQQ